MEWKAIHMFIHDMNYHETFLVDFLKPKVKELEEKKWLNQFFYISYWQGGNHIRFRFQSKDSMKVEEEIKTCFQSFLEIYEPKEVLSEEMYYSIYGNNKENVTDLELVLDRSFKQYQYEPEIERYGGLDSIPFNEKIFEISSKYALSIREESQKSLMKKVICGLDMFALAIQKLPDRKAFLQYYQKYWNGFSDHSHQILPLEKIVISYKQRYQELMRGEGHFYDDWKEQFQDYMEKASENQSSYQTKEIAKTMMTASQVHMNHNRLGLFPQLEPELASILYECECAV